MRKYFRKEKVYIYFEISIFSLKKSLKSKLLLNEMSQAKEERTRFDYGIGDIFNKLSKYLSLYFGISLENLENFREYFEY